MILICDWVSFRFAGTFLSSVRKAIRFRFVRSPCFLSFVLSLVPFSVPCMARYLCLQRSDKVSRKESYPRGFSGFVSGRNIGRGEDGGWYSLRSFLTFCGGYESFPFFSFLRTFVYAVEPKVLHAVPLLSRSTGDESRVVPFVVLMEIFYPTPIGGIGAINGLREVQGAFM